MILRITDKTIISTDIKDKFIINKSYTYFYTDKDINLNNYVY